MLFNLDSANNIIISYFFFLFLYYWRILFNSCCYYTNFFHIAELAIPKGKATKEAKAEMETHPVIVQITICE